MTIASAVFDSRSEAERAVADLRSAGVPDRAISVIGRDGDTTTATDGAGEDTGDASDFVGKAALGGGVGALLGVAALAIPGVGPLAAAGAIAQVAIGGAAVTGTALGAAAGGLESVMTRHGVSEEDASYYGERVNNGGIFVSVDTNDADADASRAQDILYDAGGHNASRGSSRERVASNTATPATY